MRRFGSGAGSSDPAWSTRSTVSTEGSRERDAKRIAGRRVDLDAFERVAEGSRQRFETFDRAALVVTEPKAEQPGELDHSGWMPGSSWITITITAGPDPARYTSGVLASWVKRREVESRQWAISHEVPFGN